MGSQGVFSETIVLFFLGESILMITTIVFSFGNGFRFFILLPRHSAYTTSAKYGNCMYMCLCRQ